MIVNKEEAKKLWCPMVNASVADKDGMIISNRSIISRRCIADECMMWVWVHPEDMKTQGTCGLIST